MTRAMIIKMMEEQAAVMQKVQKTNELILEHIKKTQDETGEPVYKELAEGEVPDPMNSFIGGGISNVITGGISFNDFPPDDKTKEN